MPQELSLRRTASLDTCSLLAPKNLESGLSERSLIRYQFLETLNFDYYYCIIRREDSVLGSRLFYAYKIFRDMRVAPTRPTTGSLNALRELDLFLNAKRANHCIGQVSLLF